MVADLFETLLDRFIRHVIEADAGALHVVEQRFQRRMEERQPVLLALIAPPAADGFIKRIIPRIAAEERDVARPEKRRRGVAEGNLADRHQRKFRHGFQRALRFGVERLDAFERIAEKIESERISCAPAERDRGCRRVARILPAPLPCSSGHIHRRRGASLDRPDRGAGRARST